MSELRALLPKGVGRDEVDAAAEDLDWRLVNIHPASAKGPRRVFFATGDGEGWVTLVEEPRLACAYVEVAGHDAEALLDTTLARLGERQRDAVLEGRGDNLAEAVAQLAVARPTGPDAAADALLTEAEAHPDPDVRQAAAWARRTREERR